MLGWATVGMSLFYFAWRYNVLFVTDTQIDTRGLIYPRAIKQLFTGLYLAEVCMIGLFGASVAPGPLVLMVAFLIFTVLFHISLNSALNPLLYNLPLSLLAEEEARLLESKPLLDAEPGSSVPDGAYRNGDQADGVAADGEKAMANGPSVHPAYRKKPNPFTKFLKPWIFSNYETMRELSHGGPAGTAHTYAEEVANNAYHPPSVASTPPLLWIPRDPAGVSRQEIAQTNKIIPITDEGCELDEEGHIIWDRESTRPPVWEEKILY